MKRCTRCGEKWPADTEFFSRSARNRDGLDNWCKACWSEYKSARYPVPLEQRRRYTRQERVA
jgi:hypothetical protein